jgi:Ulp1 family protease
VDTCPCLIHTTISHPIFFSRIQHFFKSKPNSEYHIFESSFLYNLHYVDYQSAKNWAKKVDVFQKHVLLMPMCTDLHWILYVVVNPHQCGIVLDNQTNGPVILCLDSLGGGVLGVESSIRDFLEKEWKKSTNHAYLAFPFSEKNIPLLIPKGSLLVFPVLFGMHYHQSKYLTNSLPLFVSVSKQVNSYDCGVFVCQYMLAIVHLFLDFPKEIRLQKKLDG